MAFEVFALVTAPLEHHYRAPSGDVRRSFRDDPEGAKRYYAKYIEFVKRVVGGVILVWPFEPSEILDIGCGAGWSTQQLAEQLQTTVVGMDVHPSSFEAPIGGKVKFVAGSALALPFRDDRFEFVTSYQTLEHVENPEAALDEMRRVTSPGGVVIVAGPNLLGIGNSLRRIGNVVSLWTDNAEWPRHPFGNTLPQAAATLGRNTGLVLRKSLAPRPQFTMRTPDLRPPCRADSDACYLLNPFDLEAYFLNHGWNIRRNSFPGRPAVTRAFAGGTWFAAQRNRD